MNLHKKDRALLEQIKSFLGVGKVTNRVDNAVQYRVSSIKDLDLIINRFDKYNLITQKRADYLLFKQAFEIIKRKEHLTPEGLKKLVSIKAFGGAEGLPEKLQAAFPGALGPG